MFKVICCLFVLWMTLLFCVFKHTTDEKILVKLDIIGLYLKGLIIMEVVKTALTILKKKTDNPLVKSVVTDEVVDIPVERLLTDIIYKIYTKKRGELE